MYPKFVQINLRIKTITGNQNIRGIQNEELLNETNKKSPELEEIETLLENQKHALKNEINADVFEAFNNKMNEIMTNATHNLKRNHVKKSLKISTDFMKA